MDTVGTGLLSIVGRLSLSHMVKPCMLQLVGGNQFELQTTSSCLLLGVSIIGSSTVCNNYVQGEKALEQV